MLYIVTVYNYHEFTFSDSTTALKIKKNLQNQETFISRELKKIDTG